MYPYAKGAAPICPAVSRLQPPLTLISRGKLRKPFVFKPCLIEWPQCSTVPVRVVISQICTKHHLIGKGIQNCSLRAEFHMFQVNIAASAWQLCVPLLLPRITSSKKINSSPPNLHWCGTDGQEWCRSLSWKWHWLFLSNVCFVMEEQCTSSSQNKPVSVSKFWYWFKAKILSQPHSGEIEFLHQTLCFPGINFPLGK